MVANHGTKRASPGAEEEKSIPDFEMSDEEAASLSSVQKDIARAELVLERLSLAKLQPIYAKRREIMKKIPRVWPVAFMNNETFQLHVQHTADQSALSYLEDVWIERDPKEPRCFTIEFYFKENPYFSDPVLKKQYKYITPPAADKDTPDEDGITETMMDFTWERDVEPQAFEIHWKDESKNFVKLHPRQTEEDEDLPSDPGSFFNYFTNADDPFDLGVTIANELFPEVTEWLMNGGTNRDTDDSEDEEDDSDEEEIDLEKPTPKKAKRA